QYEKRREQERANEQDDQDDREEGFGVLGAERLNECGIRLGLAERGRQCSSPGFEPDRVDQPYEARDRGREYEDEAEIECVALRERANGEHAQREQHPSQHANGRRRGMRRSGSRLAPGRDQEIVAQQVQTECESDRDNPESRCVQIFSLVLLDVPDSAIGARRETPVCGSHRAVRSYEPLSFPTWSTARKASCGISTEPTCFIRFLPSFCFSSNLRLRELSPP